MKRRAMFAAVMLMVAFLHSFASDRAGTIGSMISQPTLTNGGSLLGYVFVTLSDGTNFYIAPNDIAFETELSMLLTAKSKGWAIGVGKADGSGCIQGTNVTWGSVTYFQIFYMTLP